MINLCLVVIATQFSETKRREMERIALERMCERRSPSATRTGSSVDVMNRGFYGEILVYIERGLHCLKTKFLNWWSRKRKKKKTKRKEERCKENSNKRSETVCDLRTLCCGCYVENDEEHCLGLCRDRRTNLHKSEMQEKRISLIDNNNSKLQNAVNICETGDFDGEKDENPNSFSSGNEKLDSSTKSNESISSKDAAFKIEGKVKKVPNGKVKRNVNFKLNGTRANDADDEGASDDDAQRKKPNGIYKCCNLFCGNKLL